MVERAYSVTFVCPSISVQVQDGVSNLYLSFSGISNFCLVFQAGGSVSFAHISSSIYITANIFQVPKLPNMPARISTRKLSCNQPMVGNSPENVYETRV